jgi:hypothetical protein
MKLIATTITETAVHMRYADNADAAKAKTWIDFQVPLEQLTLPPERPLEDPELQYLAEVRLAALRYAREVIFAENQRLSSLANRMR